MITYIDIETIPQQPEEEVKAAIAATIKPPAQFKKQETINAWHNGEGQYAGRKEALIEDEYRKTSFDASKGQICSLGFATENNPVVVSSGLDERDILISFFRSLKDRLNGRQPYFVGHYISGFDLKFIFQRAVILGIRPPFDLCQHGRHDKDYFDTMIAWAGYKDSISQDDLCKALGIEGKPNDIDGSKVWEFYKAGKHAEISAYNVDDVEKVRQIHKRLTFS